MIASERRFNRNVHNMLPDLLASMCFPPPVASSDVSANVLTPMATSSNSIKYVHFATVRWWSVDSMHARTHARAQCVVAGVKRFISGITRRSCVFINAFSSLALVSPTFLGDARVQISDNLQAGSRTESQPAGFSISHIRVVSHTAVRRPGYGDSNRLKTSLGAD